MPTYNASMTLFNGYNQDKLLGRHIVGTHSYRAMLLTTIPTANTATDAALTEVTGDNYTAGGVDISATLNVSGAQATVQSAVDLAQTWVQSAGGFTGARAVVIRNATTGRLVCFGDITQDGGTTPVSSVDGPVDVNWNGGTNIWREG